MLPSKGPCRYFMEVGCLWTLKGLYGARLCVTLCISIMYEPIGFTYVGGFGWSWGIHEGKDDVVTKCI